MRKLLKVIAFTIALELTTSCRSGWSCKKRYASVR